jgi:hypothetical protein
LFQKRDTWAVIALQSASHVEKARRKLSSAEAFVEFFIIDSC